VKLALLQHHRIAATAESTKYYCAVVSWWFGYVAAHHMSYAVQLAFLAIVTLLVVTQAITA